MRLETDGDGGPQLGAADVDIYCLGIIVSPLSQTQDQGPGPGNQITALDPRHDVPVSRLSRAGDNPTNYNVFVSTLTVNISYISLMML